MQYTRQHIVLPQLPECVILLFALFFSNEFSFAKILFFSRSNASFVTSLLILASPWITPTFSLLQINLATCKVLTSCRCLYFEISTRFSLKSSVSFVFPRAANNPWTRKLSLIFPVGETVIPLPILFLSFLTLIPYYPNRKDFFPFFLFLILWLEPKPT